MRVCGRNHSVWMHLFDQQIQIAKTVFPLQTDWAEDVFAPPSVVLPLWRSHTAPDGVPFIYFSLRGEAVSWLQ